MNPRAQIQRIGGAPEQGGEGVPFATAESLSDFRLERGDQGIDAGDERGPGRRQAYVEGAPVALISVPPRQAGGFDLIDQADHAVAVDAERAGELLLGLSLGAREIAEDPEGPRRDPQRRDLRRSLTPA